MNTTSAPLTVALVARLLGRSEAFVRRHDADLKPVRTAGRGVRLYDEAAVREYAAKLAAKQPTSATKA